MKKTVFICFIFVLLFNINYKINAQTMNSDVDLNVGYTRLICFYSNSPTNSIQDFIWTSSNENVVTVSEFGTILAVGEGEAYIYGVYKYNDNFIAQMYVYVN